MIFAFRLKTSSGTSAESLRAGVAETSTALLYPNTCSMSPQDWNLCSTSHEIFIRFPLLLCVSCRDFYRRLSLSGDFSSKVMSQPAVWAENINFLLIRIIRDCKPFIEHDTADVTHDAPFSEWERAIEEDEGEALHNDFGKKFVTQQAEREKRCRQIGGPQSIVSRDWRDLKRCISVWREKIRRNSLSISTSSSSCDLFVHLHFHRLDSLPDDVTFGR